MFWTMPQRKDGSTALNALQLITELNSYICKEEKPQKGEERSI